MAFKEQSTYSYVQLLNAPVKTFHFKTDFVQTDKGLEFIMSFDERKKGEFSLFEAHLKELGITHKLIRPVTRDITVKLNGHTEKITNISILLFW